MRQFLIRLDDACPTMEQERWARMERLLDKYDVKPLVGVIPNNQDPDQILSETDIQFWDKIHDWQNKNWEIAMHGFNHLLDSKCGGINPIWESSEFAGVPLEKQKIKIREGLKIFHSHNIFPKYFFAPCHTFDNNTLKALKEESDIRVISDTIGLQPYRCDDFIFIPQFGGRGRKLPLPGIFTFCFHPSTMSEKQFDDLEQFIRESKDSIVSFSDFKFENVKRKSVVDRLLTFLYFSRRKLKSH